jgi:hypothetical protein
MIHGENRRWAAAAAGSGRRRFVLFAFQPQFVPAQFVLAQFVLAQFVLAVF